MDGERNSGFGKGENFGILTHEIPKNNRQITNPPPGGQVYSSRGISKVPKLEGTFGELIF